MKPRFSIFALLFLLLFSVRPAAAARSLVLSGVPYVQVKSSEEESIRIEMDSVMKNDHRVVIVKEGDEYYWQTRDRKKLTRSTQGSFTLFIDPTGGGYIKVTQVDGKVIYMEHLSQGLGTFTYWGVAEHFEP